mmetsp:Transcript_16005/g.48085  ORF Transcript_16005/g.48085 Transcript_16005/m.48085 type:complete len:294 (-) Transcript_16005:453-1334(-)|eukprot:CAMPEP_0174245062 /NCGR_PEP_ID=MMETSP0417-20130205/37518_1 /TAXON_ID=242541 /ORGANISM="Mayorella sp, Strain BSH-02190019" /LENGTH=293 /DNA_ID=CAMNT_0015324811 /DNA_START=85 /DNA_END=966 /DNA_ORIENTATION=+
MSLFSVTRVMGPVLLVSWVGGNCTAWYQVRKNEQSLKERDYKAACLTVRPWVARQYLLKPLLSNLKSRAYHGLGECIRKDSSGDVSTMLLKEPLPIGVSGSTEVYQRAVEACEESRLWNAYLSVHCLLPWDLKWANSYLSSLLQTVHELSLAARVTGQAELPKIEGRISTLTRLSSGQDENFSARASRTILLEFARFLHFAVVDGVVSSEEKPKRKDQVRQCLIASVIQLAGVQLEESSTERQVGDALLSLKEPTSPRLMRHLGNVCYFFPCCTHLSMILSPRRFWSPSLTDR